MEPVKLTHRRITMDCYAQDPHDPHPTFPQWSTWSVYPYQSWGTMRKELVQRTYYTPTLENEFLRIAIAPDVGGRIWDVYDKIGKRHIVNFNPAVQTYNAGFGNNYTCAGIECNYPLAHSCTTSFPREVSTRRNADGSASIIISEYERIWRTRWSVTYTLYPGRSFLELRVRIYNRTPHDSRYMYWNNCGFYLTEGSQFIFPEERAAMHGEERKTFSWPLWQHLDQSMWRETPPEMLGLYMLESREPYFGYYDHGEEFGLVHYGDLADLPGKKSWTWGTNPELIAAYRKTHSTQDQVYGEVQSGRIVIQEHLDRVPPETECEWSEIWFPVRGTGAFNGAGPGAALRAEVVGGGGGRSRLKVVAMGNGAFPRARLVVSSDGMPSVERPLSIDPERPAERTLNIRGELGPDQHTVVTLRDADGQVLARSRLRAPNTRDAWREAIDFNRPLEPVGVEHVFIEAEKTARDWGNHELVPLYEKAVELDKGFSPARRELGKLAIWQGLYDQAVEHLESAHRRDEDSLEIRYFLGLALMYAGRTEDARKAFELACRYDWEARSLARLAELCMREQDWHHALKHLGRLADAHPRLTRPRGLRAACLRKLGRRDEATVEITAALALDGQDPFLHYETMFARAGRAAASKLSKRSLAGLIDQVRGHEPPLLEALFDYLSVGLYEEAEAVAETIPAPGPLTAFAHAYALDRIGEREEAMEMLRRACTLDIVGHQAWRLEMIPILEWAAECLPAEPRPVFLLGDILMARRRAEDAAELWKRAEQMGEQHYLLLANLAKFEQHVAGTPVLARDYLRKAAQTCPEDPYIKLAAFDDGNDEEVRALEHDTEAWQQHPPLAAALLRAYLRRNDYERFDALCRQVDFSVNHQLPGPHSLWFERHIQEALQRVRAGELERALDILESLGPPPPHLGRLFTMTPEKDRIYYHIGCIHEEKGRTEKAREAWEEAVALPHYTGFEKGYWCGQWRQRYFQALALEKLGRRSEANAFFDAMELLAGAPELPVAARQSILDLVERGRFAPDDEKDPTGAPVVEVATRAEA